MYEAFEARGPRRAALAREALEISPDCADAYLLLAEETPASLEQARDLLEQGVAAGERALRPQPFEEDVGYFWGILETRPYMRARAALAETLWALDRREEAVEHQRELLRLNPNDNQGVRRLPKRLPDYVGFGDESEAVDYAAGVEALWAVVPGALAWLES